MVAVDRAEVGVVWQQPPCRPLRLKVFTVASLSSIAATMSPLSAVGCCRTTTQSPSQMAASIIESPDLEQEEGALADDLLGEREDILDQLVGRDRDAGGNLADDGDVGGLRALVMDARLVDRRVRVGAGHAVPAVAGALGASGDDDLDRARAHRVAAQVALALQGRELVGHRLGEVGRRPHRSRMLGG